MVIAGLATALAFAMTLLLTGAKEGIRGEGPRIVDRIGADEFLVASGGTGPFTTPAVVPVAKAAEVAGTPRVRAADPLVLMHAAVGGTTPRDVNVIAYRTGGLGTPPIHDGRLPRRAGEAVVDTLLGRHVGDVLQLGGARFRVVGTATGVTYYYGTPTVFIGLGDAQRMAYGGAPVATTIAVRGHAQHVPAGLTAMNRDDTITDLNRTIASASQTITLLDSLLWLMAIGIVASITYLSALERTRDVAVLKATGAHTRTVFGGFALQAVVLSLGAAAIGAVLARLLAPAFPFTVTIRFSADVTLLAVAVAVGLLASLAGLRRIVSVDPALAFAGGA